MLPENVFDPFLRSISAKPPLSKEHVDSVQAIPASFAVDETNRYAERPIRLWFTNNLNIGYEQAVRGIRRELERVHHKDSSRIANCLLAILALHPEKDFRATDILNSFIVAVSAGQLAQYVIFKYPPIAGFQRFAVGQFIIGELKIRNIRISCRTSGSDFFDRYKDRLLGRFSIERNRFPIKVIDWSQTRQALRIDEDRERATVWDRSIEEYFGALAELYFEDFWEELDQSQQLLIASGAPILNVRQFRLTPLAEYVSCFMEINGEWGHVFPGLGQVLIDFGSMDKRIPATETMLLEQYGIDTKSVLPSSIRNYAAFVSKAIQYATDGLIEDSVLHFVISLEILFSERQQTSESVKRRVSLLVHRSLKISLQDAEKMIQRLYDARSRYVHAGEAVDPNLIVSAKKVCQEVLWALLRRTREHPQDTDVVNGWTKDIDYVYSALDAGKTVADEDWKTCGVLEGVGEA